MSMAVARQLMPIKATFRGFPSALGCMFANASSKATRRSRRPSFPSFPASVVKIFSAVSAGCRTSA